MKILYRYILYETTIFFGIALFAFTAILLTLRMLQFTSLIVDKGVELSQIAMVFVAIVPTFLQIAIPLSTLLAVLLAFSRFSGDSEIVVMRTSGVSLRQLTLPVVLFGCIVTAVGLYVSHTLKPWGYQKLAQTLFEIAKTKSTSGLEQGIFNKLGVLTMYAEGIDHASGELRDVLIDDRREQDLRKVVLARTGTILSDEETRTIVLELRDGDVHEIVQGKYVLTHFQSNALSLSPEEVFHQDSKNKGKQTNELNFTELQESQEYLSNLLRTMPDKSELTEADYPLPVPSGIRPDTQSRESLWRKLVRLRIELGERFSLPFASFALALLGLPLGVQPPRTQRTWGAGLSAIFGMAVFVFYYALFSIGIVLAQGGLIPPAVALWLPNVSVLVVALFLLRQISSERWQSVAQAIETWILAWRFRFTRGKPA